MTWAGHDQVPITAEDGDRFTCTVCGVSYVYVVLEDGFAEWVQDGGDDTPRRRTTS